jgi:hypothetical protein
MWCCIGEAACFIFGIVTLVKGQLKLSANRVVTGGVARVIGALMMMPLILGLGGEFLYGAYVGFTTARQGKEIDPQKMQAELFPIALGFQAVGGGVPLLIALVLALSFSQPPRPARDEYEDDDYDDRPRRRKHDDDEDEEEDDDRPPRRSTRDDDEHIKER